MGERKMRKKNDGKGPAKVEARWPAERNELKCALSQETKGGHGEQRSNVGKGKGIERKGKKKWLELGYSVAPNRPPRSKLKVWRNFLMYVRESIGRWLAFILTGWSDEVVVTYQFPRSRLLLKSHQWILSLVFRTSRSRSRSFRTSPGFPMDRNARSDLCAFVSFSATDNWTRVSPRNRAGSRAIKEREKRDREAG